MPLDLKNFSVKKQPQGIFEFTPDRPHILEFGPIFEKLNIARIVLLVQTNDLIVARFSGKKIRLFRSGRVAVEGAETAAEAKKTLGEFLKIIN